ncbi:MAG: hypothetical protein QOG82_1342 [Actinomycetota bacterium]|jgi:hypothetical protein|nr:hypothetical protein [Actinomycetota bacterium]
MGHFPDHWTPDSFGIDLLTAQELRDMLAADETLHFVFEAQIKRTRARFALELLSRGIPNFTGHVYVVITDRSLLLVDVARQLFGGDRLLYGDYPLPSTFGEVTGRGWIVLAGRRVFVPGGRKVIERAEAALRP